MANHAKTTCERLVCSTGAMSRLPDLTAADGERRYPHPGEGEIAFPRPFCRLRERGFDGNVWLESPAMRGREEVDAAKINIAPDRVRQWMR